MSKEEELKSGSVQAFMAGFAAHNQQENVLSGDDMYFQSQCRIIRGEEAKITLIDGSYYQGVFTYIHEGEGEDETFCIFLKAAEHYHKSGEPSGEFLNEVQINLNEVATMEISEFNPFSLLARSTGGFLDNDVSGTQGVRMRDLQKWEMDYDLEGLDANIVANLDGLDDTTNISAEERRQDVRQLKEFDETQYTSVLNKKSAFYKHHRQKAEQIASNIMNDDMPISFRKGEKETPRHHHKRKIEPTGKTSKKNKRFHEWKKNWE